MGLYHLCARRGRRTVGTLDDLEPPLRTEGVQRQVEWMRPEAQNQDVTGAFRLVATQPNGVRGAAPVELGYDAWGYRFDDRPEGDLRVESS